MANTDKKQHKRNGRPPKYETPEDMQKAIDDFFNDREKAGRKPTVAGLTLALGFNSRQSILNYEGTPRFLDVIKKARMRLQDEVEERLLSGQNPVGSIFWLKNQGNDEGWRDLQQSQVEHSGNLTINCVGFAGKKPEKQVDKPE